MKVKVVNVGSCNGCELEILDLLHQEPDLVLCDGDEEADVVLVTGALTEENRARAERVRLRPGAAIVRVGSCGVTQGLFLPPDGALDRVSAFRGRADGLAMGCPPPSADLGVVVAELRREGRRADA